MARVLLLSGKLVEIQISNVHRKGVSLQNYLLVHFDDNSPTPITPWKFKSSPLKMYHPPS